MGIRLDHVAVAVRDLEEAIERYEKKLGLTCERVEEVPSEKARVAFFDLAGPHLELVASLEPGSPIDRSIERRGEGLHHICLEVDDIEATLAMARAAGLALIHDAPVAGAGGTRIAFVHPKAMHGVLIELVEK